MAIVSPSAIVVFMKSTKFVTSEYYHIFNRGVEKRQIFSDDTDTQRFLKSIAVFNTVNAVGSIYEYSFESKKRKTIKSKKLVEIICYCLNNNHYHLLLRQSINGGLGEFIRRLGIGYTSYFNIRNKRSGVLFQGRTKSAHIDSNEYLLHLSAYINLNHKIHPFGDRISKSSWEEYVEEGKTRDSTRICSKQIVLRQFKNCKEYKAFALEALDNIRQKKTMYGEMKKLLLD